jgi:hypothetical protein
LQKKIFELSTKILTTNYDKSLEHANKEAEYIPYKSNFKIANLSKTEKFIFKIHGCVDYPDDCILFRSQYEKHYNQLNLPVFELQKIFSEKTILFIGFSANDPYLSNLFDFVGTLYKNFNPPSYIITTDTSLNRENINSLLINSYDNDFENLIEELITFKLKTLTVAKEIKPKSSNHPLSVSVLTARPVDKNPGINFEEIFDSIKNYNIECHLNFLNEDNLQEIGMHDYLIIFATMIKGSLIIEDEYIKSKQVPVSILEDYFTDNIKGVFVFYVGEGVSNNFQTSIPIAFINVGDKKFKEVLTSFTYKILRKADIESILNLGVIFNKDSFHLIPVDKGDTKKIKYEPYISKFIDRKNLTKFIGRKTDIENIIRKIIDIKIQNKILTIKGSGGIGKTTIISKAAIELAERGVFEKGVEFIPCHSIQSFENFEFYISQCFDLSSSKNLKTQIVENFKRKNKLIILDNFETLLYSSDYESVVDLISFICDYSTIIVTSRQLIDLEFEEVYELRNFTTDEGVALFKSIYLNVQSSEEKVLRKDIIENLLNNNPLAIKLIAKGLPSSKDINKLKEELEMNIFKGEDIQTIFERPEDLNIEKSNSIYHSIDYSYQKLTEQEKLAFELLSLFPDGIPMEHFKKFSKSAKTNKVHVDDKEIKSLDNKSLLENSNQFLKLQSIISRFSDFQFKKRSETIRNEYYTIAFEYNSSLVSFLLDGRRFNVSSALKFLDYHINNFNKCLEFINECDSSKETKLEFIDDVASVFQQTNQPNAFIKRVNDYSKQIKNSTEFEQAFLELIQLKTIYWTKNFDQSYEKIRKRFPIEYLKTLNEVNLTEKLISHNLMVIYVCEGYSVEILKLLISKQIYNYDVTDSLFELGFLKEAKIISDLDSAKSFFDFEIKYCMGSLTTSDIDNYLIDLFKKENIEIVQSTYLKAKAFGGITENQIKQLIISNPYTEGLIYLLRAFLASSEIEKKEFFEKAITNTSHIKYYHAESILQYCKYLRSINDKDLENWLSKGLEIAKRHMFRFLSNEFENIKFNKNLVYDQNNSPSQIDQADIDDFIQNIVKKRTKK